MKISQLAIDRLSKIKWLENVGKKPTNLDVITVTWEVFLEKLSGPEWESLTLDASNEITGLLASKFSTEYQHWNFLVRDAKKILEREIIPAISHHKLPTIVIDNIRWDLINYLMEDTYKDKLKGTLFFEKLIVIYEAGNMPCGWEGQPSSGKFIIY